MTEEENIENATESLNAFFHECHINVELRPASVTRLGALAQGKNRPIRVTLDTEDRKWEVLKRINAVKIRGIFARLDMSREEREKDFSLRRELRETRGADPENSYKIVKGKVTRVQE